MSVQTNVGTIDEVNFGLKNFMNDNTLSATQKKRIECFGKADILTKLSRYPILKEKIDESEKENGGRPQNDVGHAETQQRELRRPLPKAISVKLDEICGVFELVQGTSEADEISKAAPIRSWRRSTHSRPIRRIEDAHFERDELTTTKSRSAINGVRAAVEKIADVEKLHRKAQDEEKLHNSKLLEREFRIRFRRGPQHVQASKNIPGTSKTQLDDRQHTRGRHKLASE